MKKNTVRFGGGMLTVLFLAAVVIAAVAPHTVMAGSVSPVAERVFDVRLADGQGKTANAFPPGSMVTFNIRFGLMLSDIGEYPVLVTLVVGKEGPYQQTIESYNGTLQQGLWNLTEQVKVLANWGPDAPFKVIVRVRMFSKAGGSTTSYYSYNTLDGTFRVGY
jgi:hypothetical protein